MQDQTIFDNLALRGSCGKIGHSSVPANMRADFTPTKKLRGSIKGMFLIAAMRHIFSLTPGRIFEWPVQAPAPKIP